MSKKGLKNDTEKERWDLVPMKALNEVVKVLTFGAKKYSENNWKLVSNGRERYYAAALRHLRDAQENYEARDKESGLLHLAHAACCILFLIWFVITGTGKK